MNRNRFAPSTQESCSGGLLHALAFFLFFAALGAILCGLLWATGNTDFRTHTGMEIDPPSFSFGGLSEIPFQLQR